MNKRINEYEIMNKNSLDEPQTVCISLLLLHGQFLLLHNKLSQI